MCFSISLRKDRPYEERHLLLDTRCPIKEKRERSHTISARVFGNVHTHYPYVLTFSQEQV